MKKLMLTTALITATAFGMTACSNTGVADHHATMPQHNNMQNQSHHMHAMQHSPAMMNHTMSQLNLTEKQKAEIHALHQNQRLRGQHMHDEMMKILTPEQRQQMQQMHSGQHMNQGQHMNHMNQNGPGRHMPMHRNVNQ